MKPIIQALWIGSKLSTMEQLCVRSFQQNGHEFHLYLYGPCVNVPAGTVIKDANEILPEAGIKRFKYIAHFANLFQYKLQLERGGWWVDMDVVCLKPYDFPSEYVFYRDNEETVITNAVVKAPAASPLMQYCCDEITKVADPSNMDYQAFGPALFQSAVKKFGLTEFAQSGMTFDPTCWKRIMPLVNPTATWDLSRSYSLHLFHAAWTNDIGESLLGKEVLGKALCIEGSYPEGCLYEQLKRRYMTPKVSIMMTTFNRPNQLRATLESIARQTYKDYEIIVVDDGTDSETPEICKSFGTRYHRVNRPQSSVYRNPARPTNIGIRMAKGEILILQNAECKHIDPETIQKLTSQVTDTNAVFARVTSLAQNGGVNPDFPVYCSKKIARPLFFCGAIKRELVNRLRGFDEDYVSVCYEDDDFAARLKKEGIQFVFTDIDVHHQWHPYLGVFDVAPSRRLFDQKTSLMDAGKITAVRNLNREWGSLIEPTPAPVAVPAPVTPARPVAPTKASKYANDTCTIDWWSTHPRK